jgi:hypothetical protein
LQLVHAGQREAIARGKQLLALVQDGIPSDGLVLLGAEDRVGVRPAAPDRELSSLFPAIT